MFGFSRQAIDNLTDAIGKEGKSLSERSSESENRIIIIIIPEHNKNDIMINNHNLLHC